MKRMLLAGWITLLLTTAARGDDWPQWRGPQRDGVWREKNILDRFPAGGPKVLWRAPIGGGYAGPAVSNGRVFVTERLITGDKKFSRERVVCLNESDGKPLWTHAYDCQYTISYGNGPRATPVVDGDRVYTLGAQGHLKCLSVTTGDVLWEKLLAGEGAKDPAWGYAAHPLIEGNRIFVLRADKEGTAAAFDKITGKPLWTALPAKDPGYAPPTLCTFDGTRQLVIWLPESVNALDPDTGKTVWSQPFGPVRNNVSIVAPTQIGEQLFVTSFWDGSLMLRPKKDRAEVVWKKAGNPPKKTQALHSLMSPPIQQHGFIYGICAGGQLRCIRAENGEIVWETMKATTNADPMANTTAFLTLNDDRAFIANDNGELILSQLMSKGYIELDRAKILEPTQRDGKRQVLWSHPAYANGAMLWRNDREIVRVDLAAAPKP